MTNRQLFKETGKFVGRFLAGFLFFMVIACIVAGVDIRTQHLATAGISPEMILALNIFNIIFMLLDTIAFRSVGNSLPPFVSLRWRLPHPDGMQLLFNLLTSIDE